MHVIKPIVFLLFRFPLNAVPSFFFYDEKPKSFPSYNFLPLSLQSWRLKFCPPHLSISD